MSPHTPRRTSSSPTTTPTCSRARTIATIAPHGSGTRRVATGHVKVRVPLVGGKVEQAIVAGLQENSDAQADLLTAWIAKHG